MIVVFNSRLIYFFHLNRSQTLILKYIFPYFRQKYRIYFNLKQGQCTYIQYYLLKMYRY